MPDVTGIVSSGMPWGAIAQAGAGLLQSFIGGIGEGKSLKRLERLQTPTYTQNQSILDYYNKALQRYGVSPTDSALYKRQRQDILGGTAQGIGQLQERRTGQAGIPALIAAQNRGLLDAEVAAENQQNQRFGQLAGATQMKATEDTKAYQQNVLAPYEKQFNLLAAKAGKRGQLLNAGLSNIFGATNTYNQMNMLKDIYSNK